MRKGVCKHYNGPPVLHGGTCIAGVEVKKRFTPPLPCFARNHHIGQCSLYQEPSSDEIKAAEDEINKAIENALSAVPLANQLKQQHSDQAGSGTVECPVCSCELKYSVSACNNHIRMKCVTDDCLDLVE